MARTKMTAAQGWAALEKEATAVDGAIKLRDSASFNYLRLGIKLASDSVFAGEDNGAEKYWNVWKERTGWKGTAESETTIKSNYTRTFTLGATATPEVAKFTLAMIDTDLKVAEEKLRKSLPKMSPYSRAEQIIRMVPQINALVKENSKLAFDGKTLQKIIVRKSGEKTQSDPLESLQKHMTSIQTLVKGPKNKPEAAEYPQLAAEFDALQRKVTELVVAFNKKAGAKPAAKNGKGKLVLVKSLRAA